MKKVFELTCTSQLLTPAGAVWQQVNTLRGVNQELLPLLRMTAPSDKLDVAFSDAPVRKVVFGSWLLLFGFLPFDIHQLRFDEVWNGGFRENSQSLVHRVWRHEREILSQQAGCSLTDTLQFEPRVPILGYILLPIVRFVFQHRHRRLRHRFGVVA